MGVAGVVLGNVPDMNWRLVTVHGKGWLDTKFRNNGGGSFFGNVVERESNRKTLR